MNNSLTQLQEIALRIRDMREILGLSIAEMARNTGLDEQTYVQYEGGSVDLPFTFIHKCSQTFGICLLYTSPSPRDQVLSRMPSSA